MKEEITKYKKYILGVIGILLALTMSVGIKYLMKPKYEELPEVKLRDIKSNKSFAIMIQTDNGYEEYNSDTWPGEEYKFKEAKCIDNNGALVNNAITFADGKATLETDKTVFCTLYFDIKKETIVDILREKTGCLTDELVYGLYRCQGNSIISNYDAGTFDREDTVKNNYICLGADCNEDGKDLYRIIGVTEKGLMKVIKNTTIDQRLKWSTYTSEDIKWPDSLIYQYLNNEFYNSLSIDLKGMIVEKDWYYGDINTGDDWQNNVFIPEELEKKEELLNKLYGYDGSELTDEEKRLVIKEISKFETDAYLRTEANATESIPANIGLMSITDYCSSFESTKDLNCRTSYHASGLKTPTGNDIGSSWLTPIKVDSLYITSWTMSRYGNYDGTYAIWDVESLGHLYYSGGATEPPRPVFFLTSDIELSGEGTIDRPFRIGIE